MEFSLVFENVCVEVSPGQVEVHLRKLEPNILLPTEFFSFGLVALILPAQHCGI